MTLGADNRRDRGLFAISAISACGIWCSEKADASWMPKAQVAGLFKQTFLRNGTAKCFVGCAGSVGYLVCFDCFVTRIEEKGLG
jgi:hypothetical protein